MKKIATILLFLLATSAAFAQPPVAVNDTVTGRLGEYVTVNVTANDYSPEGLSFRVFIAPYADSFTDSTITYYFDYDKFNNFTDPYYSDIYMIVDENGQVDSVSQASVFINLNNNVFTDTLDIGNIRAGIYAYNNHFWPGSGIDEDILFEFPKGSGKNTLFTSALWVGGLDQNGEIHLAADKYRQSSLDYWTGPLSLEEDSVSIDIETVVDWHRVWKLDVNEILYHKAHWSDPGYEPIKNIKTWPAHGDTDLKQAEYLAPFVDVDDDGVYDPYSGDYPLIRGDQCIFFIFNDQRPHLESRSLLPIGLEIHGMAYAFERPDNDAMNNTIFTSYKIFNRSGITLEDTYIGLWADFDIGYAFDDFVGCDVGRGAFYGYNGEEIDGNGEPGSYGENPPAQAVVMLGGPWMDPNGEDNPSGGCDESINGVGFGDGIADNERYGMSRFVYYSNNSGETGEPIFSSHYYGYMTGLWKDSTVMEYGGNGHISGGAYGPAASFMFPGLSDPCYWGTGGEEPFGPVDWTEESSGNEPFDRRGMSSMGPFTLVPGVVQKVDIAYVAARGDNGPLSSVALMKEYIDIVRGQYMQDPDNFGYQWLGTDETLVENTRLEVYPNPASTELRVNYDAQGRSITYTIYDLFGREIETRQLNPGGVFSIQLSHLEKGMYVLKLVDEMKVGSTIIIIN